MLFQCQVATGINLPKRPNDSFDFFEGQGTVIIKALWNSSPPAIHCAVVKQHHEVFDQEAPAGLPQRCLKFVLKVGQHVWVSSQCSTVFRIKPFSGRFIIIGVHTSSSLSFIVIVLIFCFIFCSPGTQRASKVSLSKVWWRASMRGVTFTADLFPFFILNLI